MSRAGLEPLLIPKLVFATLAHPVSIAFKSLILSSIPRGIFSPSIFNTGATVELLSLEDQLQSPLQDRPEIISGSKNWDNYDLDVFICIKCGPGYSVGIHSRHLLVASFNS